MQKTSIISTVAVSLLALTSAVLSATIQVPQQSLSIQGAIDMATEGDTVRVAGGIYQEHIAIDKRIHVIGDGAMATTIDGMGDGNVVTISANGVTFKNFAVTGGGDSTYFDWYIEAGMQILKSDSCIVEFCSFHDNGAAGLALAQSDCNIIRNCLFSENVSGVYFYDTTWQSDGFDENIENQILHNHVSNNTGGGIIFRHMLLDHRSNLIRGNLVSGNHTGLSMIVSQDNIIKYNCFVGNSNYGIFKTICSGGGDNNRYNRNCFLHNNNDTTQAHDDRFDFGPNNWSANYWSDYTGTDENHDGYGDEPYYLDSYDLPDYYADWWPLMEPEDSDGDSIIDSVDNAIFVSNPDQSDADLDFIGDVIDSCIDFDDDGFGNPGYPGNICGDDNCPFVYNPDQMDIDGNGIGDACDAICGDLNADWMINILDVSYLINYLYKDGPEPVTMEVADTDFSCAINLLDVSYLVNYLYKNGDSPSCPPSWPCE